MAPSEVSPLAPVTEDWVIVGGVRSPYLHAGPADAADAVVFVHGNPGPAAGWRRLVARTGTFARAIAPDMPGYGGADKPDRFDYTVDGYWRTPVLGELFMRMTNLPATTQPPSKRPCCGSCAL